MNYTKIRISFRDGKPSYISEDELVVFKLAGEYWKIEYLNDEDQWHRTDGPAYEETNYRSWWVEGKRHRLDGPSIEWGNGSKSWYVNDKRHKLDGPAIEYANGRKEWWIYNKRYSQEEFEKRRSNA